MLDFMVPPLELALRAAVIYVAMVVMLRLFGKREVGQFTLFDLVLILLVANAVQPAMTGPDNSLSGGLVIILTLVLVNRVVASARARIPGVRRLIESQPTVLARDGAWINGALAREDLDLQDCEAALRTHGVARIEDVELAVLESDGTISVVPRDRSSVPATRRKPTVRLVKHL